MCKVPRRFVLPQPLFTCCHPGVPFTTYDTEWRARSRSASCTPVLLSPNPLSPSLAPATQTTASRTMLLPTRDGFLSSQIGTFHGIAGVDSEVARKVWTSCMHHGLPRRDAQRQIYESLLKSSTFWHRRGGACRVLTTLMAAGSGGVQYPAAANSRKAGGSS